MKPTRLVLVDGRFAPGAVDGSDSLLVEDGRIVRFGRAEELRTLTGARVVELRGRTVSPGFHDAHFHFLQLGIERARKSLRACESRDELLDTVRDAVRGAGTRPVLVFEHWDESSWPDPDWPHRSELDSIAPTTPILLRRIDGHSGVANGAAIALFDGLGAGDGVDPSTGVVREGPVRNLEEIFPPSRDEQRAAFAAATRLCLSLGITTTTDFLLPGPARSYEEFLTGDPEVRVNAYRVVDQVADLAEFPDLPQTESFRWRGIKVFGDGSIGGRNAALFEPYADRPDSTGDLLVDAPRLRALIHAAHSRGWAAAIHAIGDRAIAQMLDAFGELPAEENRTRGHRIEHLELPRAGDLDRLSEIGVRPCVQPNFVGCWAGAGGLYETALGQDRLETMNPFRSLVERGARPFFGSDGMPASPRFGIASALGHPIEQERITLEQAHALYTSEPAEAVRHDLRSGRLEVGADADLVVLPEALQDWAHGDRETVDLTIVGGIVRYDHRSP